VDQDEMIDEKLALKTAWQTGHFWNPAYPDVLNVSESDVDKLTTADRVAQYAVASLQQSDANLLPLSVKHHGRAPLYDGQLGPATMELIGGWTTAGADLQRCPLPDFAPPPNASFHYEDQGLQRAVETMQANATGSGSWPACDPDKQGLPHSFRVRIDPARMPNVWKAKQAEIFAAVVACYAEMGAAVRYIFGASGDCEIAKRFESLAGSVIGWNEFPSPNTCNQTISGRLDTGYDPSDWRMQANLETHETGHGVGLQHTRGHIMNPSILLVWPLSWKGGPSESTMRRYFGGEPVGVPEPPPVPTPTPTPIPPGTPPYAEFTLPAGTYQIVKKGSTTPPPTGGIPT
jgi:hypothetical protein